MAYATLVSLAQTIDHLLDHDQYSFSLQQKQHIISIHESVIFLQAFLEYSPEKADDSLEGRIGDAASVAEDIIENLMSAKKSYHGRRRSGWTLALSRVMFQRQLKKGTENLELMLKEVTEELDSIAGEVMSVKNSLQIQDPQTGDYFSTAASSSKLAPTGKNVMVDSDGDLLAIKERLCGGSSKLQIIPIVGMGGIGKTTLARNCYDDKLIVEHFQICVWITISQDYREQEILSELLFSMKEFIQEGSEESNKSPSKIKESNKSTADIIYQTLKGRSYLIVMDDVWSTNVWDNLKRIFPDDNKGSRIMLTTRQLYVAAYLDSSSSLHEMRLMDTLQSWDLLRQKVFANQDCPPQLEHIGKEIAGSCSGLPLAIVVIAGVLSTVNKTRSSWGEIAKNVSSAVSAQDGLVDKILSLSYRHLPHHLRSCFLYMGGFPEDHEIRVSRLIKVWVAKGFLKHIPDGSKTYEERAEEYLEDLVKRSLVLVTRRKPNGKIKICGIHDLVRDMCVKKALEKRFIVHVVGKYIFQGSIKNQHHTGIFHGKLNHPIADICVSTPFGSFGHFRLLRVLDVLHPRGMYFVVCVPDEIFELFHLRFLGLYNFSGIPDAISNLQNLQTLIICQPYSGRMWLPSTIWRMPQLRHLMCHHFVLSFGVDGCLTNLQTLSSIKGLICSKRDLGMIPNLKKLGICYTSVSYDKDYQLENLVSLYQLEELKLEFHFPRFQHELPRDKPFLGKLNPVFPRMLRKLTLKSWQLPWTNMTVVGSLPYLEVLKLIDHKRQGDTWETSEGGFPCLKYLFIDSPDLEHWIAESSHFPRLKFLIFHDCQELSEIPDDIGEIPTLELIEVVGSSKSLRDSALRIQEEQQSYGNDDLQVRLFIDCKYCTDKELIQSVDTFQSDDE